MRKNTGGPKRRPRNLSLDPEAIARGERYSRSHATNLSRLVGDFLRSLPLKSPYGDLAPVVQRLHGLAAGSRTGKEKYREHLQRKYGGR